MSVINTNITSMIGQQNLSKSQNDLTTSMERLSSGLRINSAKDDAAGQAIANRMTAQITGLSQAQRNANDGISVSQTAEGGLNQINDNLQRVRELSVQAQNGTNSNDDLVSIQDEINQRLSEIDRISKETDFNGTKVLGEGSGSLSIQVGANDGETISVNLEQINSETLGVKGFTVSGLSNQLTELTGTGTGGEVKADVSFAGAIGGLKATSADELKLHTYKDAGGATQYAVKDTDGAMYKLAAADINTDPNDAGFGTVTMAVADAAAATAASDAYNTDAEAGLTATANPMATLDDALNKVDSLRSELGAVQNRFESAIDNLSTNETNLSSARSRIEDADYATEVANMTRAQILQQAGTSVLAQANQIPQSVLSLLG